VIFVFLVTTQRPFVRVYLRQNPGKYFPPPSVSFLKNKTITRRRGGEKYPIAVFEVTFMIDDFFITFRFSVSISYWIWIENTFYTVIESRVCHQDRGLFVCLVYTCLTRVLSYLFLFTPLSLDRKNRRSKKKKKKRKKEKKSNEKLQRVVFFNGFKEGGKEKKGSSKD
jgi:hypothetical protein